MHKIFEKIMKIKLLTSVLILFLPLSLFSSDLKLGKNTLSYNLSKEWNFLKSDSTEGTKNIWFKRNHITNSKNIDVIPNLSIEIFNIVPKENNKDSTDIEELDMIIMTLLLNKAPIEVLEEYKNSKGGSIKYSIPYKPSYGFVSNYTDNFGDNHDCYYITLMKENKVGVFIVIDCTQEVFPKIDKEVEGFLNSLTLR